MNDFIESTRWKYLNGVISRDDAIQSVIHFSGGTIPFNKAEDIVDGSVVSAARHFQSVTSMAKIHETLCLPARLLNLLVGFDNWFGDAEPPNKKLACHINVGDWAFYFCFGRHRGVTRSLIEGTYVSNWSFKALILHANNTWYIKKDYDDSELEKIKGIVYGIDNNDSLVNVVNKLGLIEDTSAHKILGVFD